MLNKLKNWVVKRAISPADLITRIGQRGTMRWTTLKCFIVACVSLAAVICTEDVVRAGILTPSTLNPGDQFRIVFITSSFARNPAVSSNIADYDAHISARAVAGGINTYNGNAVTWRVLGSTATVSALSRLGLDSPALFLVNGTKIADSGADLWDGSIDARFDRDEFGGQILGNQFVHTGTNPDGTSSANPLGHASQVMGGSLDFFSDHRWITDGTDPPNFNYFKFGFSEVLTVPGASPVVPEPASLGIWGGIALAGLVIGWRRNRM